jgi:hypothetical protein
MRQLQTCSVHARQFMGKHLNKVERLLAYREAVLQVFEHNVHHGWWEVPFAVDINAADDAPRHVGSVRAPSKMPLETISKRQVKKLIEGLFAKVQRLLQLLQVINVLLTPCATRTLS